MIKWNPIFRKLKPNLPIPFDRKIRVTFVDYKDSDYDENNHAEVIVKDGVISVSFYVPKDGVWHQEGQGRQFGAEAGLAFFFCHEIWHAIFGKDELNKRDKEQEEIDADAFASWWCQRKGILI